MANKPSIPKGTRDFSPEEMIRRNFIFDTIRSVFKKYGYQQIETPAMENTETLMGKYGEEGDKLIFKILNSGDYNSELRKAWLEGKISDSEISEVIRENINQKLNFVNAAKGGNYISEKALRYDLTVPFARYVVQHQNEITFPFKRYQIQPVWRADKPQKGRYREFYQCDADVIGSNSLINEVELCQMIDEAFTTFNVPVRIKINNRKILAGIAEIMGAPDKMIDIAIAIDKADKIGWDGVEKELVEEKGFTKSQFYKFQKMIEGMSAYTMVHEGMVGRSQARFNFLKEEYPNNELIKKGVEEMQYVFDSIKHLGLKTAELEFFVILARGLNYYTGAIFEVEVDRNKSKSTFTSSICGGGRYDDLTGIFGLPNVSGVGISFGIDRIFDVLNEVGYPEDLSTKEGTRLMFFNNGGKSEELSLQLLREVRAKGIASEIYPDKAKWEKQAKYVDAKKIPFTANVDEEGKIALKYKLDGKWKQEIVSLTELINKISA